MITTKRQIRRDTDRFGGYGTESISSPLFVDYDSITNTEPPIPTAEQGIGSNIVTSDFDMNIMNAAPQTEREQPIYTTLAATDTVTERPAVALPERPVKEKAPHSRDDILPTVKTRAYATEAVEAEQNQAVAPTRRERHALDSRTKILLCIYIAVALVLAIAVIATGVSISTASAQAEMISEQIAQKQAVIVEQEATLATLRDDDAIRGKAMQNGMVSANEPTYSAEAAETVEYPYATPNTGAFDNFCDWLSKVIN